jgi:hypothetical protein
VAKAPGKPLAPVESFMVGCGCQPASEMCLALTFVTKPAM